MNKTELVERIAIAADISKASAGRALDAALENIKSALAQGQDVGLVGFGSFHVIRREARSGRHPRTGEALQIKASAQARFRPGKALKDALK
ncbi:MAG: HU family DNA-binding protein [Sterolibacterium sp.]|nr:HU family DNA-binding protein [Sterolibacterium sp.]